MATSGSIDFNRDRNQVVTRALKLCGVIEAGETPAAEEMEDGAEALNALVKAWQADGFHLWKKVEGVLYLEKGTVQYAIGVGGDHSTTEADAVKTELSAAAAATDTAITVDSITGIADADNIGVEQDDGTLHWTTVSGAPSGSTVTLATGMVSAAAVDNHVYVYTSKIDRPLRVIDARRRDEAEQDIPIIMFSREEYMQTPNKTTQSRVTEIYYDPQLSNGQMYVWPAPSSVRDRIHYTAALPIEDFDNTTDNPDLPQEWLDALTFGLAVRIAPEYGVPIAERTWLKQEASEMKAVVMAWDDEPEPVYFGPDLTVGGWG